MQPAYTRAAFEDISAFLGTFTAPGFDFGTWVTRQGSFPFVAYHPEVAHFVRVLERHGWVHDFLWGPWLRSPEAAALLTPAGLAQAGPPDLARLLTVFARQERLIEGSRLAFYQSGVLVGTLRRAQELLETGGYEVTVPPLPIPVTPPAVPGPTESSLAVAGAEAEGPDAALPGDLSAEGAEDGVPEGEQPAPLLLPASGEAPGLSFAQASQRVDAFISQFEEGYFPPLLMLSRLTEEMGEVARVLAHQSGKKPKPGEAAGDLEMELADLLFVVFCLANEQGLDLARGFERMMGKIEKRDAERWTKKKRGASKSAPPAGS